MAYQINTDHCKRKQRNDTWAIS